MSSFAFVASPVAQSRPIVANPPLTFSTRLQFTTVPRKHASLVRVSSPIIDGAPPRYAPGKPTRILLWLDAHLRVHDNPALSQAARDGALPGGAFVPLRFDDGAHSRALAAELAADLRAMGSDLLNVSGVPRDVLPHICRRLSIQAVYYNARGRTGVAWQRERAALNALKAAGVQVRAFEANVLPVTSGALQGEKLKWTRVRDAIDTTRVTDMVDTPDGLPSLPQAARLIKQTPLEGRRGGGTSAAISMLNGMSKVNEMSFSRRAPTDLAFRLKMFLDYGCVSTRLVAKRCFEVLERFAGCTYEELVWRTFLAENVARVETGSVAHC